MLGDGDACPQDPAHGRMYFIGSARQVQWCPNARHKGNARYAFDGVTPVQGQPGGAGPSPRVSRLRPASEPT